MTPRRGGLALVLLCLLAGCADEPPPRGVPGRDARSPPAIVAALDEAGGRYVQVTITGADEALIVREVTLELPRQAPIRAREIRRGSVAGDVVTGRPTIGIEASGGSRSSVSTGVGIGFPIGRTRYRSRAVATIDVADPALYRRLAGDGVIVVVADEEGRERRFEIPAPLPRQ